MYITVLNPGTTQLSGCNTASYCLNRVTRYVCSGDTAASDDILRWRILNNNNSLLQSVLYAEGQTALGDASLIIIANNFRSILTSNSGPMMSNLSFTSLKSLNNYTIQCIVDTTMSCRITIPGMLNRSILFKVSMSLFVDIPAAPDLNELDVTSTYVNISWPESTHPCLTQYMVIRSSAVGANTSFSFYDATITSLLLPISQLNDTEQSYGIWIVDTGDRLGNAQVIRMLTPNGKLIIIDNKYNNLFLVPLSVTNLMLTQTNYPTDTNDTVNITVSWNEVNVSLLININFIIIYSQSHHLVLL